MLQVGFGSADITPPLGAEIPGGFFPVKNKGAREKLLATACVVHDGQKTVALVGVDILDVCLPLVKSAREQIHKATKIPGSQVLINASHTHSGGPRPRYRDGVSEVPYSATVARGVAEAVTQAWNSLHAAEIGLASGKEESIAFNRRFRMRDGRTITHPGKPGTQYHDRIVAVEGPIDPAVGVMAARDSKGKIRGFVVNFGCHSTVVGGDLVSPDYAGYLRKHLRTIHGDDVTTVFLLGACGDVTQVDNRSPGRDGGPEHADMMGQKLAAEVTRVTRKMVWLKETPLAVASESVKLAVRPDPDVDRERPAFGLGSAKAWEPVYAQDRKWLAEFRSKSPTRTTEVQAIRIGPLGIVTNGSEYFASECLRIKAASPFKQTWMASLTNDALGYIPSAEAFFAGGYEPRTGAASFLAADSSQRILEASLRMLNQVAQV